MKKKGKVRKLKVLLEVHLSINSKLSKRWLLNRRLTFDERKREWQTDKDRDTEKEIQTDRNDEKGFLWVGS